MKLVRSIMPVVLASLCVGGVFVSCNDDELPQLAANVDALVVKTKIGEEVKYAPAFYIYGNKDMKSVSVVAPGDGTLSYTLSSAVNSKTVFMKWPADADFTATAPAEGDYEFTATSTEEGEAPLKIKDKVGPESLDVPTITSSEFASNKLKVKWESITGVNGFVVQLISEGSILFSSPMLQSTTTEFAFGLTDQGWLDVNKRAEEGKTYSLQLKAIRYETGVTYEKEYNIQCLAYIGKQVTWSTQQ